MVVSAQNNKIVNAGFLKQKEHCNPAAVKTKRSNRYAPQLTWLHWGGSPIPESRAVSKIGLTRRHVGIVFRKAHAKEDAQNKIALTGADRVPGI
jgi:hypothetical protein